MTPTIRKKTERLFREWPGMGLRSNTALEMSSVKCSVLPTRAVEAFLWRADLLNREKSFSMMRFCIRALQRSLKREALLLMQKDLWLWIS
jgi:hypothetical protein